MNSKLFISIIISAVLMTSCGKNTKSDENSQTEGHYIEISRTQYESNKMSFGEIQKIAFDEVIKCNGSIVSKSTGVAQISPSVSGLVQKIYISAGQRVTKGQALFELTGNEFIELQRDFAETASQLKRVKSEYERIKSLYKENIGSEKELISAESEYKSLNAKYSALKMKLQYIGLDASTIETAEFKQSFQVKSPISGFVSQINVSIGQHADQQTNLAEVIDVQQLQLKLSVFEKDITKLSPGQKVIFKLSDNTNQTYNATLNTIGKTVDDVSKTVQCFATINDMKSANFVNNAYAEIEIHTKSDIVSAISEEAILKSEGNSYVLSLAKEDDKNYYLNKIKIEKGRLMNGNVEILNKVDVSKVLIKGAYNINVD